MPFRGGHERKSWVFAARFSQNFGMKNSVSSERKRKVRTKPGTKSIFFSWFALHSHAIASFSVGPGPRSAGLSTFDYFVCTALKFSKKKCVFRISFGMHFLATPTRQPRFASEFCSQMCPSTVPCVSAKANWSRAKLYQLKL